MQPPLRDGGKGKIPAARWRPATERPYLVAAGTIHFEEMLELVTRKCFNQLKLVAIFLI